MTVQTGLVKFQYKDNEIDWTGLYISNKDIQKYIDSLSKYNNESDNTLNELISLLQLCQKEDNFCNKIKHTTYIMTLNI